MVLFHLKLRETHWYQNISFGKSLQLGLVFFGQ